MEKKKIMSLMIPLFVVITIFFLCFSIANNSLTQMPNITQMNYNLKSETNVLKIEDIENLSQRINLYDVTFCAEVDEIKIKEEMVTPVLTNEYYFDIYDKNLDGQNFTKENIENRDKVVIIGSDLALELFFNTQVVGKTLAVGDDVYTICGVFEENNNILNQLSKDGKQRIYFPYTCYPYYSERDVNVISYENASSAAPLIEQMGLGQYYSTNFSEKSKVIKNFQHILLLVIFLALCFFILKLWYKSIKKLSNNVNENLTENYFFESVKKIPHKYLSLLLTSVSVPAVLLIIYFSCDFSIFIIPKYIPYDNIFDFAYYLDTITTNQHQLNSMALSGDTSLISLYQTSFNILSWLILMFVFDVIICTCKINSILKLFNNAGS